VNVDNDLRHELALLVLSRYPFVVIETADEGQVERLLRQVTGDLGLELATWSSSSGLSLAGRAVPDTREPDRALERALPEARATRPRLAWFRDLHPYLERPEVVRRLRESEPLLSNSKSTYVLTGIDVELPQELASHCARLEIALPDLAQLERLVERTAAELASRRRIEVELSQEERAAMAQALRGLELGEARRVLHQAALRDGRLDAADLPDVLAGKKGRLETAGLLEWAESSIGLDELGGAPRFKAWATRRREAFTPAARRFGLDPPRGLLLVGVPGSGKSMSCRALAGEWRLPLLRLDPGRMYDKYVGQTEANLRRALGTAEAMSPSILWIDEIEKALATGDGEADAGLSQRILGTLLTWMQERKEPVFMMASANDVDRLPIELLRRGRFDEVFFFDLPTEDERRRIFAIHLERRGRVPADFDLAALAQASEAFSGAEIEGTIVAALYHAFSERSPLTDAILQVELAATRPLAVLRPEKLAAIRRWGRDHATTA
jgi:hypothetical protein